MHLKSHQNDNTRYELLSFPAQLNVDADKLAENRRLRSINSPICAPRLQYTKVQVHIGISTVSRNVSQAITQQYQKREMERYLLQRHHWNQRTLYNIHWNAMSTSLS